MFKKQIDITYEDVISILHLNKIETKKFLASKLQINFHELLHDLRLASFIDYLYDCFKFIISIGTPVEEVVQSMLLCQQFLLSIFSLSIIQSINLLTLILLNSVKESKIGVITAEKLACYLSSRIFPNFKLYQYVYTKEREINLREMLLIVNTPLVPIPLKEAQTADNLEYNKQMKALKAEEVLRMQKIESLESYVKYKTNLLLDKREERILFNTDENNKIKYSKVIQLVPAIIEEEVKLIQEKIEIGLHHIYDRVEGELAKKRIVPPKPLFELENIESETKIKERKKKKSNHKS